MALSNLLMVFAVEYLVRFKFHTVQVAMDKFGVAAGILVLMALMFVFALVLTSLVHGLAPEAGGSGSAENKAWLNGFDTSKLFSPTILAVRFVAVIFSNTTGFPCGREGPIKEDGSADGVGSWQQAGDTEPVPVQTPLPREQRSDRGPSKAKKEKRSEPQVSKPDALDSDMNEKKQVKESAEEEKKKRSKPAEDVKIPAFDVVQKHHNEFRRAVKRYTKLVGREGTGESWKMKMMTCLSVTMDAVEKSWSNGLRVEEKELFRRSLHIADAPKSFAADVPVTVFGVGALLKVCVVAGQAPLFPSLSRATWSRLGLRINFYNISASSQQLGLLNGRGILGPVQHGQWLQYLIAQIDVNELDWFRLAQDRDAWKQAVLNAYPAQVTREFKNLCKDGAAAVLKALGHVLFEEVSSSFWPMELTFKSFVGCTICTTLSYSLLAVVHRGIREFVIFEMWYGPAVQDYRACDILPFIILSVLLGFLAPLHTMLCLKVQEMRKHLQSETVLRRFQPWAKMIDTVLFAILCAAAVGLASLSGECHEIPEQKLQQDLSYVQFQCEEGFFNPVASLLLTTPDGAVKMLFNRDNFEFLGLASAVSFLTYFTLNVLFTGVPVPTGNFTGAMLIGGMAGRLIGCVLGHLLPQMDFAPQGIYSMIGAAAMLSGFKQMTIAPVMFIVTAANNVDIAAPLMMAVSISLFISHMVACQDAWDEEQLIRKKLPYLPPEFCKELRHFSACDLMDELPAAACQLKPFALTSQIDEALMCCSAPWFPMLDGPRCASLLPRSGLEKQRRKHLGTDSIHVGAVAQRTGIQILEGTSAASLYPLFAQAHLQAACVVTADGTFAGIVSRAGLAAKATEVELVAEKGDCATDDSDADSESSDRDIA
ncbi:Chloride channel protein B [Durusdinium trenchii]|uniref:Chloride channel protein B n=1 Tax=Durusdinium trenchii TaxID=1381693 RepID=A0ABP0RNF7_9DINO